jgi:hypothetical protein
MYGQDTAFSAETGLTKTDMEGDIAAEQGGFHQLDPRARLRDPALWKKKRQAAIDRYYKKLAAQQLAAEGGTPSVNGNGKEGPPWKYILGAVVVLGVLGGGAVFFMKRKKQGKKS